MPLVLMLWLRDATFEDRCEFAVNTLRVGSPADELTFWIQHVQWANPGYAYFAMPVLWDDDNGDFDFRDPSGIRNSKQSFDCDSHSPPLTSVRC